MLAVAFRRFMGLDFCGFASSTSPACILVNATVGERVLAVLRVLLLLLREVGGGDELLLSCRLKALDGCIAQRL